MARPAEKTTSIADLLEEVETQRRDRSYSSNLTEGDYLTSIRMVLTLAGACDAKQGSAQLAEVQAALEQVRDAGSEVSDATAKLIDAWKRALGKTIEAQNTTHAASAHE